MTALLLKGILAAYLAGALFYVLYVFAQKTVLSHTGLATLGAGFLFQTLDFLIRYQTVGHFPVVTFQQTLSFFAWAVAGGFLLLQLRFNLRVLGALVAPLALCLVLGSSLTPGEPSLPKLSHQSVWLPIHVISVFLGNGIFALAFLVSLLYLLQERSIKGKKLGFFFKRLPPLHRMDSINYRCLMVGFPLLSLGMVSGSIYAQVSLGSYWRWDPMEVWSLITWFLYAALLHQRITMGWHGRRAAVMSIIGFLILLFTFLGAGTLMQGYHTFAQPGETS